jgi:hypothetical protein
MAGYAIRGTAIAAVIVLLTYPTAWARMRQLALEGGSKGRRQSRWLSGLIHGLIQRPGERAAFHFIGQTITRNNHYQVYLAIYCGSGLALASASAVTFETTASGIHAVLSDRGLHAVMPLMLFWVIAGLKTAFAFPLNLSAGWIFRMTGASVIDCASAARRWVLLCAIGTTCAIITVLRLAGWNGRQLFVQAVFGLCLCALLTDGFFIFQQTVPFNQRRMPGRTNLPLMLTLYVGVFPPFIFGVIYLEKLMEGNLFKLLLLATATILTHGTLRFLQGTTVEIEEEMEGYEGEFQLLGLS